MHGAHVCRLSADVGFPARAPKGRNAFLAQDVSPKLRQRSYQESRRDGTYKLRYDIACNYLKIPQEHSRL
jgi:hypothetical protein